MATHDIIVIGASTGGVHTLKTLVEELPADLPAAVLIVLHIPAEPPSLLPRIFARESSLPVAHAINDERILPGRIYLAPPDQHLLIEEDRIKLVHGPKENLHRPSIDALFRSAARWAGPRTIGVILTGARDDGKAGMRAIKTRGGITVVQDPTEAPVPSMPMSVLQDIRVDYSVALREMAPLLGRLSRLIAEEDRRYPVPENVEIEARIPQQEMKVINSVWGGVNDEEMLRFRCHVGNAYSADALSDGQSQMLECALWSAVRALEEQMLLAKRIVQRARKANHMRVVSLYEKRVEEAEAHSSAIRQLLLSRKEGDIAEPPIPEQNELRTS